MSKIGYVFAGALVFALLITGMTLLFSERISAEGFFPAYQGPTYVAHGWPWAYVRFYEQGGFSFLLNFFVLDVVFWFVIVLPILSLGLLVVVLVRKTFHI